MSIRDKVIEHCILLVDEAETVIVASREARCPPIGSPFLEHLGISSWVTISNDVEVGCRAEPFEEPNSISVVSQLHGVVEIGQAIFQVVVIRPGGETSVGCPKGIPTAVVGVCNKPIVA